MSTILTGRRRLYLMRHGHVDYFAPGLTDFRLVDLTQEGREQAEAAGLALSGVAFDRLYHTGLPRTRQTAQAIRAANDHAGGDAIGLEEAAAFEELRGGVYRTDSREELAARLAFSFDDAIEEGAEFLPGGERFADAYDRVVSGFDDLLQRSWRTALLVAHEGVNRLVLGHACGAGLGGIGHFEQDLGCINILDIDVVPSTRGEDEPPIIQRVLLKAVNITPYDYIKAGLPKTSLEHMFGIDFGASRPARST